MASETPVYEVSVRGAGVNVVLTVHNEKDLEIIRLLFEHIEKAVKPVVESNVE